MKGLPIAVLALAFAFFSLISPAQITGLPSLAGYIKSENHVLKFHFRPDPRPERARGFVPRPAKLVVPKVQTPPGALIPGTQPPPISKGEQQQAILTDPVAPAKTPEIKIWE